MFTLTKLQKFFLLSESFLIYFAKQYFVISEYEKSSWLQRCNDENEMEYVINVNDGDGEHC